MGELDPIAVLENFKLTPGLIIIMIIGLVEFAKKFPRLQVIANISIILSMVLGILFGALYFLQAIFPTISLWVNFVVFILTFGVVASGLWSVGREFTRSDGS